MIRFKLQAQATGQVLEPGYATTDNYIYICVCDYQGRAQ